MYANIADKHEFVCKTKIKASSYLSLSPLNQASKT